MIEQTCERSEEWTRLDAKGEDFERLLAAAQQIELITAAELLVRLPVLPFNGKWAVWRAARLGNIPAVRIGCRYYFNPALIAEWLKQGGGTDPTAAGKGVNA